MNDRATRNGCVRGTIVMSIALAVCFMGSTASSQPEVSTPGIYEPESFREAGENLTRSPWVAVIEAELMPGGEEVPTRMAEMTVWFESSSLVRLRLGRLQIEITPGQFLAFHEMNDDAYYLAIDPRKGIADLIASELPPLWCPWLAIALADGDVGVWPVVGAKGHANLEWSGGTMMMSGGSSTSAFTARPQDQGVRHVALVQDFHSMIIGEGGKRPETKPGGLPAPYLSGYKLLPEEGSEADRLYLWRRTRRERNDRHEFNRETRESKSWYESTAESIWPAPVVNDRVRVRSIEALTPPLPALAAGDRFPAVSLSYRHKGRDLLGLWRSSDVFDGGSLKGNGPSPTALVLAVVRADAVNSPWLSRVADAIERARPLIAPSDAGSTRPPIIAGSPVVATEAIDGDLDAVQLAAEAWGERYTAHDADQRFPSRMPIASWLPASLLLDRVAPEADGAVVVIDRSGWITGVITPDVRGDALVNAIADAVRSAAR